MHGSGFAGLVCLPILFVQGDLAAQLETDVNIATDLDISASVGRDEEWLERFGAVRPRAPEPFSNCPPGPPWAGPRAGGLPSLSKVALPGRHGRVGVAV